MFCTDSFQSSSENMLKDNELTQALLSGSIDQFCRIYTWEKAGITQSEKRAIPAKLTSFDTASRLTGGGIVFHCPGDIVFSQGALIHDDRFPKDIKDRCAWVSNCIQQAFLNQHIPVTASLASTHTSPNITFCASYHNPFELMIHQHKLVGIAVKKTRDCIIFQGVIHLHATANHFDNFPTEYSAYMSTDITQDFSINVAQIISFLKTKLYQD